MGVYAYWRNSVPSASLPATSTFTSYPLELRVELDKTEFQQEELIKVHVYYRNISNRTVEITTYMPRYDFNITDTSGTTVYQYSRNHGWGGFDIITLKPGAELNATLESEVFYDDGSITGTYVPFQLSKGETYKIIVFTYTLKVAYVEPWEWIGVLTLKTPPITITVI